MDDIMQAAIAVENTGSEQSSRNKPFDKEAWGAAKQAERTELFERSDKVAERVADDPEALKNYLSTTSRFTDYSVNNTLLIFDQKPDATRVGDYDFWRLKGAQVKKNEKGIGIIVPGDAYERGDGSIGTGYNVKRVFDISQTNARPRQPKEPDMRSIFKALVTKCNIRIQQVSDMPEGIHAMYDPERRTISTRDDLDGPQYVRAIATQIALANLPEQSNERNGDRALMVAYVVCERFGVSAKELPSFSLRDCADAGEVREELGKVIDTAKDMAARMNDNLRDAKAARDAGAER